MLSFHGACNFRGGMKGRGKKRKRERKARGERGEGREKDIKMKNGRVGKEIKLVATLFTTVQFDIRVACAQGTELAKISYFLTKSFINRKMHLWAVFICFFYFSVVRRGPREGWEHKEGRSRRGTIHGRRLQLHHARLNESPFIVVM